MNNGRASLALALLLAAAARAAETETGGPRCPDGSVPAVTGHPFHPYRCPRPGEKSHAAAEVKLSSASVPGAASGKSDVKDLSGSWQGLVYYGGDRYQILAVVEKKGGAFAVRLESMQYITHIKHVFLTELKGSFWHPGRYGADVRLAARPEGPLAAQIYLGSNPEANAKSFDRELLVLYTGRADRHKVQFAFDGKDKLRYLYSYLSPELGTVTAQGELARSTLDAL